MSQTKVILCDVICMNIATQALQPGHHVCCDIAQFSLFYFPWIPSSLHQVVDSCFTYLVMGTVQLLGVGSCGSWNPLGQSSQSCIYRLFIREPLFALLLRYETDPNNFFLFYVPRPAHYKFPLKVASYVVSLLIRFCETSSLDEYLFSQAFLSSFIAHSTTGQQTISIIDARLLLESLDIDLT